MPLRIVVSLAHVQLQSNQRTNHLPVVTGPAAVWGRWGPEEGENLHQISGAGATVLASFSGGGAHGQN
jgi:hypothetical protein